MRYTSFASLLALGILVTGCASIPPENSKAYAEGWRPGTVVSIGSGKEYQERLAAPCAGQNDAARYALVRYTGNSHLRWRAYPLEASTDLAAGSHVRINIKTCNLASAPAEG